MPAAIATTSAGAAASSLLRVAETVGANVLVGVGFGLLLTAAFVIYGQVINAGRGLLWGLAGFAAFALAPSLGLPPELPGMVAGDVGPRQVWWLFTALATIAGLGSVVFSTRMWLRAAGAALIAVPHIIGAPGSHGVGLVPPELAAEFAAASLATAALFWVVLGATAGLVYGRMQRTALASSKA